jgi:hypothetical protein
MQVNIAIPKGAPVQAPDQAEIWDKPWAGDEGAARKGWGEWSRNNPSDTFSPPISTLLIRRCLESFA